MLLRLAKGAVVEKDGELKDALLARADATRHLLSSLQQAAAAPPEKDAVYASYHRVQAEVRASLPGRCVADARCAGGGFAGAGGGRGAGAGGRACPARRAP